MNSVDLWITRGRRESSLRDRGRPAGWQAFVDLGNGPSLVIACARRFREAPIQNIGGNEVRPSS